MTTTSKLVKAPRYRDLGAWQALKKRDFEYALNLLVAGEWVIDGSVKDSWSSLDARVGSERCQETAAIALVLRRIVNKFLQENDYDEEFDNLIVQYRAQHASDKEWTNIFKVEDVLVQNSPRYNLIKQAIIDEIGEDWSTFLGLARTLTSFSVLTNMEAGMPMRYRRKGDVLVETSKEQRAAGMGEYHDAEFPMRNVFTNISFKLVEKLADTVLGDKAVAFGDEPRTCDTIAEQTREIFHFSKTHKINPGHRECPIVLGSFSASMQILLAACWHYNIPITECMARLEYDGPVRAAYDKPAEQTDYGVLQNPSLHHPVADAPASVTYRLRAAPVLTYVRSKDNGGCFKLVDPEEEEIEEEPCWKLGGYSMFNRSQAGSLLLSADNDEYISALKNSDVTHRSMIFGFFHNEYPVATKNGGVNLLDLTNKVCGKDFSNAKVCLEDIGTGWRMNVADQNSTISFLSLATACGNLARQYDLQDTFIAHQRNPAARSAYVMQSKSIPYTYNHIEISTPAQESKKWGELLSRVRSTGEPMYANIFMVGNSAYSMSDQKEADDLMRVNNDNQKIKRLMAKHLNHAIYLTPDHLAKFETFMKAGQKSGSKEKAKKARKGAEQLIVDATAGQRMEAVDVAVVGPSVEAGPVEERHVAEVDSWRWLLPMEADNNLGLAMEAHHSESRANMGVVVKTCQQVRFEDAPSTPLYHLSQEPARIVHRNLSIIFEKVEFVETSDPQGKVPRLRRQTEDLYYLVHPRKGNFRDDMPRYYITAAAPETLGNVQFYISKAVSGDIEFRAMLNPDKSAADIKLFDCDTQKFLFDIKPKEKGDHYEWVDADGRMVAYESEESDQHKLVIQIPLQQQMQDVMVALWILRIWHDIAESREVSQQCKSSNGLGEPTDSSIELERLTLPAHVPSKPRRVQKVATAAGTSGTGRCR
ncbi:hypothetical protein FGRMN_6703 [Fusarium graminum]|nr:hypothetical protein FGRMN_6703 [Fusarium graminum]